MREYKKDTSVLSIHRALPLLVFVLWCDDTDDNDDVGRKSSLSLAKLDKKWNIKGVAFKTWV